MEGDDLLCIQSSEVKTLAFRAPAQTPNPKLYIPETPKPYLLNPINYKLLNPKPRVKELRSQRESNSELQAQTEGIGAF